MVKKYRITKKGYKGMATPDAPLGFEFDPIDITSLLFQILSNFSSVPIFNIAGSFYRNHTWTNWVIWITSFSK